MKGAGRPLRQGEYVQELDLNAALDLLSPYSHSSIILGTPLLHACMSTGRGRNREEGQEKKLILTIT